MSENTPTLPDGLRLEDQDGVPVLVIQVPAASARLHLDGAHLTSWVPSGQQEVLWLSPATRTGRGEAIRGGIPLVGPWFGPGRDGRTEPKHGWLRTHRWQLVGAEREGEGARAELELAGADPSGQGITARLVVVVGARLEVALSVTAGRSPLELEAALHTYLAVGDVRELAFTGLEGAAYLDNTRGLAPAVQKEELRITGPTDRIYTADGPITVRDAALGREIIARPSGSSRTVVWNPGAEGAATMPDIPDDAWPSFVCVEAAVAKDGFVALPAGATVTLAATYEVRELRAR